VVHKYACVGTLMCMRTTIEINDDLLRQAKRRAADEGTSLRALVERALRLHLGGKHRARGYKLTWRTETGRMLPGVRLDDRDALHDLMEERS